MITLKTVESLPAKKQRKRVETKKIIPLIEKFMESDDKMAKVVFSEEDYSSLTSGKSALRGSISRLHYPIKIKEVNNMMFLIKK